MPRFPVLQADDGSGTGSCANSFSYITEKLQVPTADLVVSTFRTLASSYSGKLGAWIVDERSAFRQLPVAPESRAVAVVVLCAPDTGRVAYFVMYGHPFGLSPLQDTITTAEKGSDHDVGPGSPNDRQELFRRPWGQPAGACRRRSLPRVAHFPLVRYWDQPEDPAWPQRGHPGNSLRLRPGLSLHEILSTSQLSPGRAKLLFVAGHYSGRHGRAFLGAIGERQYSQASKMVITPNIRKAVRAWIRILESDAGVRRIFDEYADKEADFLLFTDGAFPDIRTWVPLTKLSRESGRCPSTRIASSRRRHSTAP